jgi:hypothetical protein
MIGGGFEHEGRLFREETDRLVAGVTSGVTSGVISEEEAERMVVELIGRLSIFISAAAEDARERVGGPEGERAAARYEEMVSELRDEGESWRGLSGASW